MPLIVGILLKITETWLILHTSLKVCNIVASCTSHLSQDGDNYVIRERESPMVRISKTKWDLGLTSLKLSYIVSHDRKKITL